MRTRPTTKPLLIRCLPAFAALGMACTGELSAATVGHWRFESDPGFLEDSAGTDHLTNNGSVSQVASPFSNPVPGTGDANAGAASFSGSNSLTTSTDQAAYATNTFTIEAFINGAMPSVTTVFAGQFGSGGSYTNQRAFYLGANNGSLRLGLGFNGGANTANFDAFTLAAGTSYFVAASVDLTDTSSTPGAITLYALDLGTNIWQIQQFTRGSITTIGTSTAPFSIGQTANATSGFNGTIDEVRFSDTKLAGTDLLVPVPEPSTSLLVIVTLGCLFPRRRRN